MHIHGLYIHPIKSLLPVAIDSSTITPLGLPHDRTFILLRADTHKPLMIGHLSDLCLFAVSIDGPLLTVHHTLSANAVTLPLSPSADQLIPTPIEVTMHNSACGGYPLSDPAADAFFTRHLNIPTRLLYIGDQTRSVLGNLAPANKTSSLSSWLGYAAKSDPCRITFADVAPLMITTTVTLDEVSRRCGVPVDVRVFRPNIVLAPDEGEEVGVFEEDYWAQVQVQEEVALEITANCARCSSINVDIETGKFVPIERQPLKLLSRDRRIDPGMKYSPVLGRYAFLKELNDAKEVPVVRVGDKIEITKRNTERTVFEWPGLSTGSKR